MTIPLKKYPGIYWMVYDDSLSHTVTKDFITQLLDTLYYMYGNLKNKNKDEYINSYLKSKISSLVAQCFLLRFRWKELKGILEDRVFEEKIGFDINIDEKWVDVINKNIINKHYSVVIMLLKTIAQLRKIHSYEK